ncbi:DUF389 domain-containing protein [Microlunatus panaciterrae]|uniref:Hydrophobic protein (TIGR00271 family) n=1 Tax=Microlunatus panaciterrae TaxID=400768 RepID=A0ABS2RFI3_9ACTN|nr:DUF389 domain-containing protein [Microlunatus panaciterrae]MBM7797277.1 putative hydrophobic protein (TIGR00271 family) [Microlunatus panaciterrae]
MMQVRVITPVSFTERTMALLDDHPAVANIVLWEGAARNPAGDVIVCDTAREGTSEVLDQLRSLGLLHHGAITVQEVDVSMSEQADRSEKAVPGLGSDAVVWEEIEQKTSEETRLSITYLAFMVVAMIIASFGVLLDQPILIVGAMVVGPEFGPLAALCVGLVRRHRGMIGRAAVTLVVGFAVGLVATVLSTLVLDAVGLVDRSMLLAKRPLTDFIWRPDALSWVIAFLAGIAGMLSLTSAKSGALVGVLISVTTIPAASNAAVAIAYGVWNEAAGSALQLLINLSAIIIAGLCTLAVQRLRQAAATAPGR